MNNNSKLRTVLICKINCRFNCKIFKIFQCKKNKLYSKKIVIINNSNNNYKYFSNNYLTKILKKLNFKRKFNNFNN